MVLEHERKEDRLMVPTPSQRLSRSVFIVVAVICLAGVAHGFLFTPGTQETSSIDLQQRIDSGNLTPTQSISPGEEVTVITTQGVPNINEPAEIVAVDSQGEVIYYNDTYTQYVDLDPVPGKKHTVEYIAGKGLPSAQCNDIKVTGPGCYRNIIERVNLTTGEITRVYAQLASGVWHDSDRINSTHVVVADIARDRVLIVNVRTDTVEWTWNVAREFSKDSGGPPSDWTHINDVEYLDDGRIMADLRNQDQVVFLDPSKPPEQVLLKNWTLGSENAHDILFEQHNPDYIPAERGGPAVLIADSENNRIVEYHRTANGSWELAWKWRDLRLQWPRDADRLPNGNTLISDSHGNRVLELTPQEEITWVTKISLPYESERLGTGDESTGGSTMDITTESANLGLSTQFWLTLKDILPSVIVNSILFVAPAWIHFTTLVSGVVLLIDLIIWAALETWWRQQQTIRTRLGIS
jgi:hypothetical protein